MSVSLLAQLQRGKGTLRQVITAAPKMMEIDSEDECVTQPPDQEQAVKLASMMPHVAGQPLEAPQFLKVDWTSGRIFHERDDPDRMREPWELPPFIECKDPVLRRAQTTMEELKVPDSNADCKFARIVRKAFTEEECVEVLKNVNGKKFTPALVNIGRGMQQLLPELRDGHRVIVDSPELAAWLLEVLRPYLPKQFGKDSHLLGLNERMRILCYTPGQFFEEHRDGMYVRPHGHPEAGARSRITVQVYLHDIPDEYGGATTFFPGRHFSVKHQPEAGSVLLFTQDLLHEGSLVRKGIKYTIRTEVMYGAREVGRLE